MKVQEDSDEKDEPETEEPAWKAGWNLREDHWYYCKEEGKLYLGWIKLKSKWYYLDGENADIMACNEVKKIGDKYYAFDADGVMYTGWIQRPEGWYYADANGALVSGWIKSASRQDCINAFIARAYEYRGTRFIEPWSSYPGDAVDCSGFVLQCLYATGMDLGVYNPYNHRWLPSQTYNSMNWYHNYTFMPVSVNSIQRGDLVYYRGHVAIYLGNGQIIDSWPGQGVSVRPIGSRGAVIGAARPYV